MSEKSNDRIREVIESSLRRLTDEVGLSADEAQEIVGEQLDRSLAPASKRLVRNLTKLAPETLSEHAALREGFEQRLRVRWGKAFDLYEMVLIASSEAGSDFHVDHWIAAKADEDNRFHVLVSLHARACLTASEVYALLRTGFPRGAHARWRTLHELSVVATVVGGASQDVSERYLVHREMQIASEALVYQQHARQLGYRPYPKKVLDRLLIRRDELQAKYGKAFRDEYGWAACLFPHGHAPSFRELEDLSRMQHLRPFYKWASHGVHADSQGGALNIIRRGGVSQHLSGASNYGLADPGHGALISLVQVTATLLAHGRPHDTPDLSRLVVPRALLVLVDRAGQAFLKAHRQLDRDETAFWAAQEAEKAEMDGEPG